MNFVLVPIPRTSTGWLAARCEESFLVEHNQVFFSVVSIECIDGLESHITYILGWLESGVSDICSVQYSSMTCHFSNISICVYFLFLFSFLFFSFLISVFKTRRIGGNSVTCFCSAWRLRLLPRCRCPDRSPPSFPFLSLSLSLASLQRQSSLSSPSYFESKKWSSQPLTICHSSLSKRCWSTSKRTFQRTLCLSQIWKNSGKF